MPLIPPQLAKAFPADSLAAVGGAVRDHILRQNASKDLDLATTLPPDRAVAALSAAGIRHDVTHLAYGTITVFVPSCTAELTSTRTESYAEDSRFPKTRFGVTFAEDARRRDFTLGAIYLFPDGRRFDPTGGEADLRAGLVRFIQPPAKSLADDPLRLYRFARFCGLYGLAGWSGEVDKALRAAVPAVKKVSKSRQAAELARIRSTPHAAAVLQRLKALGLPA